MELGGKTSGIAGTRTLRILSLLWLALGVGLLDSAGFAASAPARVERTIFSMGTEARIMVEASERPVALAASEGVARALAAAEERLSTWGPDSELSRFNRSSLSFELSPSLAADLQAAKSCWQATDGAFDPSIAALARAWGLRRGGRQPSATEITAALARGGMERLEIRDRRVPARSAVPEIEEGGFGKGAGLADAMAFLAADPEVLRASIDLGGQVAMFGRKTSWELRIADPRRRERSVIEASLHGGSLATSGNSERGILVDGRPQGHLLDPRGGHPVDDFGSVTVWTDHPFWADCLSTGLYVLGPDAALTWAAGHPGVEVLVLEYADAGDLRARATAGLRERLRPLVEGLVVEILGGFKGGEDSVREAGSGFGPISKEKGGGDGISR